MNVFNLLHEDSTQTQNWRHSKSNFRIGEDSAIDLPQTNAQCMFRGMVVTREVVLVYDFAIPK